MRTRRPERRSAAWCGRPPPRSGGAEYECRSRSGRAKYPAFTSTSHSRSEGPDYECRARSGRTKYPALVNLAALFALTLAVTTEAHAMIFKSEVVSAQWDNWCYYHEGVYYLYYLITEHSGGEGFGVATSRDGVHWDDHGWAVRASDKMVEFLGTGAVWKAPDFAKTGKFLCNYSEWRVEEATGKKTQNILFAWSTDLIHWTKLGDEAMFRVDERYYDKYGRWDCIYPLPRAEGGYWGTWTATSRPDSPHQGTVGIGYSDDGLHWTALPAPEVTPGIGESGAFWRFGDKIHAMFGEGMGMWAYVADDITGPYRRAARNPRLLAPGHTYFSRFFPLPDGTVLVNHQSNSDWGWHIAPMKRAVVDPEGVLRLMYWPGNDTLKAAPIAVAKHGSSDAVTMLTAPADFLAGVIAEGTLRLPATPDAPPTGLYLLLDTTRGYAIRVHHGGRTEFGPMDAFGGNWRSEQTADRARKFGPTAAFRFLVRRGMVEFYLDDELMECYRMAGAAGAGAVSIGALTDAASLGALGNPVEPPVTGLHAWTMSLPGKVHATASSVYGDGYAPADAFDGDPNTRWCSGLPYGKPEWLQVDYGAPRPIRKAVIRWESAFAKGYDLQVSDDGVTWRTIYTTEAGRGGVEEITGLAATARHLRLNCRVRGTENGFSLWELRVAGGG